MDDLGPVGEGAASGALGGALMDWARKKNLPYLGYFLLYFVVFFVFFLIMGIISDLYETRAISFLGIMVGALGVAFFALLTALVCTLIKWIFDILERRCFKARTPESLNLDSKEGSK